MKLLNKIIPIVIIVFYLIIAFQNTIAYLYFKTNQSYIAENLCVQKEIKENFCMGNCYLEAIQKKLAENKKENNNSSTPVKYNSSNQIQEYITNYFYKIFKIESVSILNTEKTYQLLVKEYVPSIPPPQLIKIS